MKHNDDIENALLSNSTLDELIKKKISDEIDKEISDSKNARHNTKIEDFKKLAKEAIFSKSAIYKVFNRLTKQESFINGQQAESLIGIDPNIREKLVSQDDDSFLTGDYYVKFHYASVST